ncbi:MAG: tetratricopeptide repeat protein [Planctomycetes bacterium]|nr:tetratricopeptide repeat protein [Planctomycetota bacterium]
MTTFSRAHGGRLLSLWPIAALVAIVFVAPASRAAAQDAKANRLYTQAAKLQNGGDPDLAAVAYEKLLKEFPKDSVSAKAQHYLGYCRFRTKEYDKAIEAFDKAIKDWPKFELLHETYFFLGKTQVAKKQFLLAAKSFAAVTKAKYPKSPWIEQSLYERGEAFYNAGKQSEALAAYAAFVKTFGQHNLYPDALYALGVTQQEADDHAGAAKTYGKFLKEKPQHAYATEVGMRLGDARYELKDFSGAARSFAAAAATKDFAYGDYATQRHGEALFALKDYAKAAPVFLSLPKNFPKSPYRTIANLSAGKCLYLNGDDAKARGALAEVLPTGGEQAVEAAHWIARIDLRGDNKKPAAALKLVESFLPKAAKSGFYVNLLMDQADAIDALPGRRAEAISLYYNIFEKHPKHRLAARSLYNAAFAAQDTKQYDEALKMSAEFLETYNGRDERETGVKQADVKYVAAESHLMTGKHAEAEKLFTGMLKEYADHGNRPLWFLRCATAMQQGKKFKETIALLAPEVANIKDGDTLAEAQYLVGFSHYKVEDYQAAATALAASLAAQPKWKNADVTALWLTRSQGSLKNYAGAIATAKKLVKDFPNSKKLDQAHFWLAEFSYQNSDYKTAVAAYQQVIETWPNSTMVPYALRGLGLTHQIDGDPAAAEKSFTTLIEKHPGHKTASRAYRYRAETRERLKNYDGAIADARKFLADSPSADKSEKSAAQFVLALCLDQTNKHAEAAKSFQSLLEADPQYVEAARVLYNWAFALNAVEENSQENKKLARDLWARLIVEHPKYQYVFDAHFFMGQYHYHRAAALQKAKKDGWKDLYSKAAEQYARAKAKVGKDPRAERIDYMLAWTSFQSGKYAAAAEAFAGQLAAFPQGKLVAEGKLMVAESFFKGKDYPKAMPAFEKSLAQLPSDKKDHPLALLHAGQTATKVERFDRALEILLPAAKDFPKSDLLPEIIYETGWAKHNLALAKPQQPNPTLLDEALVLYEKVNDTGEVGARAQFMTAEIYLLRKDYTGAFLGYNLVVASFGKSKIRADALYQQAHCSDLLKKPAAANKSYLQLLKEYPQSDKASRVKALLTDRGIKLPKEKGKEKGDKSN